MNSHFNVNVNVPSTEGINVNVIKDPTERSMVFYIMRKLGLDSTKDFAYWRKVAQTLSEAQIADALEIACAKKKDSKGRIKYVTGIFRNMMASKR